MSPTWIRQRIRKYAAFVGLGYTPKVVFSKKAWDAVVPKSQRGAISGDIAGLAYDRVVYVNREKVCCARSGDDLAAHEVLHLWRPNQRHGKKFEFLVEELRLGRLPE